MSQFHTLTPSLGPGKRDEGKLHSSKWASQRRRGGGEHRDGWLVCFDVRLKSMVPVVLRVWANAASNQFVKSAKWCWQIKMLLVSLFTPRMFIENTSHRMLTNIYRLTGVKTRKESISESIGWDVPIIPWLGLPSAAFSALFVRCLGDDSFRVRLSVHLCRPGGCRLWQSAHRCLLWCQIGVCVCVPL